MKPLVDGQCGQSNSLVGLSRNFAQNNSRLQTGVDSQIRNVMPGLSRGDNYADEFLTRISAQTAAPSTFNMKSLGQTLPTGRSSSTELSRMWSNDFNQRYRSSQPSTASSTLSSQWLKQYNPSQSLSQSSTGSTISTTQRELEAIWNNQATSAATNPSVLPSFDLEFSIFYSLKGFNYFSAAAATTTNMWSREYLDSFDSDPFFEAKLQGSQWANQYLESESVRQNEGNPQQQHQNQTSQEMFENFQTEWDSIANAEFGDNYFGGNTDVGYHFQQNNPFIGEDQLTVKGEEMLRNGNIAEAIQYYEAAVQQNPQDSNAWCQLGLSLAENEHDSRAISAFRKSLEIDPRNREALLAISVSLANESMENEALAHLEKWITVYQDPSLIPSERIQTIGYSPYSSLDPQKFHEVEKLFLNAARQQSPDRVDPSLQNALGVLYNINRNFDRAIDSLQTALASNPSDARLWNRLGATLANGDRTTEAISAYRQALTLFPTFVRARYNLGISCMHLKSYRDAVEHFLSALQIQKSPENSPIWSTMRSAVLRMDPGPNHEILEALDTKNVASFIAALNRFGNNFATS
uniref:Peroxin-5 n=1 Tax=Panagrolaimus sp. ES5 TaxID=591445 RepID=A0AC34FA05_9BILA